MSGEVMHGQAAPPAQVEDDGGSAWGVSFGPMPSAESNKYGFTPHAMARIDEALTMSSRETGLTFSLYIGPLDEPTREHAERLFAQLVSSGVVAPALIAISPGQRVLQIVTGQQSSRRLPNRACALAALGMRAAFSGGDLVGGIVTGLRMLADAAGRAHA